VDLVARDGPYLVFVEVRTRTHDDPVTPLESISPRKRTQVRRVAQTFLIRESVDDTPVRFDAVGIVMADEEAAPRSIELVQDAF
jgi:putative endonuclease